MIIVCMIAAVFVIFFPARQMVAQRTNLDDLQTRLAQLEMQNKRLSNEIARLQDPGELEVLGVPVDLARITLETYVTGATADHLTPWKACYRTTQLLSGPSTFVLSNAGHIASLINPPGNPKAHFFAGPEPVPAGFTSRGNADG